MNTRKKQLHAFGRLLDIMDDLRQGCPWDKKQTFDSLRHLTIEEVYELGDAILDEDYKEIKKELGDILLHIVFYSKIGAEKKEFDIADVIDGICEKLIYRHPHIYGNTKVESEEDVKRNWELLKLKEGNKSVLGGVPKSLPALVKASRIQEKVKGVGFDWENSNQVWDKVKEEINEFSEAMCENNKTDMEEEFGDLLFSLINYARFIDINPENALEKTNIKFIKRFQYIEMQSKNMNLDIQDLSTDEMNKFWNEAKNKEKRQ